MKRLSRNVLAMTLSDVGRRIVGFATVAYLARTLGVADFGLLNVAFTVLSYALMVSSGGLSLLGARAIARGESEGVVNRILTLRVVASIVVFLIVVLVATTLFTDSSLARLVVVFSLSLFAHAFLLDWYFQGRERMEVIGTARLVSALLYLGLAVALVRSADDLLWVAVAAVFGDAASAGVLLVRYRRERIGPGRFRFDLSNWRPLIGRAFELGGGSIIGHVSVNLPILVIAGLASTTEAGLFSAANKLVFFLLVIDRVAGTLLLPASSRFRTYSPDALAGMLSAAAKWIVVVGLPLCVGGTVLADRILPVIFGAQYTAATDLFRILIWFFLLTMLHTVYAAGLIALDQERRFLRVMVAGLVLFSVTIVGGTLAFGAAGAAAAVVVSEGITVLMTRHQLRRSLNVVFPVSILRSFGAAIFMAIILLAVGIGHLALAILIGAATYIAVLVATKGVTREEILEVMRRV